MSNIILIFIEPVTTNKIQEIIQSLKSDKAHVLDNIKNEILSEHSDLLSTPITYIINKCIYIGTTKSI